MNKKRNQKQAPNNQANVATPRQRKNKKAKYDAEQLDGLLQYNEYVSSEFHARGASRNEQSPGSNEAYMRTIYNIYLSED